MFPAPAHPTPGHVSSMLLAYSVKMPSHAEEAGHSSPSRTGYTCFHSSTQPGVPSTSHGPGSQRDTTSARLRSTTFTQRSYQHVTHMDHVPDPRLWALKTLILSGGPAFKGGKIRKASMRPAFCMPGTVMNPSLPQTRLRR